MQDELVTLSTYHDGFEAELAKVRLEEEGIKAVVLGGDLVANMHTIEAIKVELQVFAKDAERAKEILAATSKLLQEETDKQQ